MIKYLLPHESCDFKANLHCHSTISDGRLSPEDIKHDYLAHGYSIVAYTDHDVLINHSELCDENFLALNGYEMEVIEPNITNHINARTTHMCFIALEPDNLTQVCYHRDRYIFGNAVNYRSTLSFDRDDYNRVYSHEGINDMMRLGREHGFFVTYNHPAWSLESYPEYSGYEGMNAFEIYNTGCAINGFPEYNSRVYDDMLRLGKRIYCIAADDNHNAKPNDHPLYDSFGGWVSIRADKLDYRTVTAALSAGSFYASCGPEIKDYYIEDEIIHITTSPARCINYITGSRNCDSVAANLGEYVTEAEFRYNPNDIYFRIDIVDADGNHADTNATFIDSLDIQA